MYIRFIFRMVNVGKVETSIVLSRFQTLGA